MTSRRAFLRNALVAMASAGFLGAQLELFDNGLRTVTSLANQGPGTLREAIETGGTWIRFARDLSGTIKWDGNEWRLLGPDVTIDGRGSHVTLRAPSAD